MIERMKQFGLLLITALWLWPNLTLADDRHSIDRFLGQWTDGMILSAPVDLKLDILSTHIRSLGEGFRMTFTDLGKIAQGLSADQRIDAHFAPAKRKGVFEYVKEEGSFLQRMFASPASGNPLEGETLLWARIDGEILAVYSINVNDKGDLLLDHYSWTRTETGLRLLFSQRTDVLGAETMIEADLLTKGEGK